MQTSIDALEADRNRLVEELNGKIEETSGAVSDLTARLGEQVEAGLAELDAHLKGEREAFSRAAASHDQDAERLLVGLRQKLGMAADESLSAGYDKSADSEERSANHLRLGAIAAGVASAIVAIVAVILAGQGGDWSELDAVPVKLAAVAAPAALATYLAKQSNGHRSEAWRLRQVRLELANLGEYLSELEPANRQEVRRLLVARYFAAEPRQQEDRNGYRQFAFLLADQLSPGASAASGD